MPRSKVNVGDGGKRERERRGKKEGGCGSYCMHIGCKQVCASREAISLSHCVCLSLTVYL